jgi:hypothetical protein
LQPVKQKIAGAFFFIQRLGVIPMFETAVQQERTGVPWAIITACVAFIVLLVVGYILIA